MTAQATRGAVAVRGPAAVRRAAVSIESDERAYGHGLILPLEGTTYVLTCHHVIAPIDPSRLRVVAYAGSKQAISVTAEVVDRLSRPEQDAVALKVGDIGSHAQAWLHSLGPDYQGGLPARVQLANNGLISVDNFEATLGAATENFSVAGSGSIERYAMRHAHPLERAGDARPGISGGVVICEGGVVGLVHFAREETAVVGRAGIMNPLRTWAEGWPALARRIQPFTDTTLAERATVVRADAEELTAVLTMRGFNADVYVPRGLDDDAGTILERSGVLLLHGRAKSGKTRIVRELVRARPDAIVVIPKYRSPPPKFESSSFAERDVIVVVDNLEQDADILDPVDWWTRIRALSRGRTALVATCRGGEDWERVGRSQGALIRRLEKSTVYTSTPDGNDLSREQGWALAQELGLSEAAFSDRFDGTPGSLFESGPPEGSDELPPGERTGVELQPLSENGGVGVPTNMPLFTSHFVGRENDLLELESLLDVERFVTITGPSGSGKTRLAFEVGARLRNRFPDGVWVAELSPYRVAAHVPSVIVRALGLPDAPTPSPVERVVAQLRGKRVLLVCNGCDHVSRPVAQLLGILLVRCPGLACLTTSRRALDAMGEVVRELVPLGAEPDAGGGDDAAVADGVELFVDRARESHSKLGFSKKDISDVGEIVRLVAGNALAIELLATQIGSLSLGGVAAKLAERISRARVERQDLVDPTLTATVDVVAEGHLESEQLLFGTLCVFVGGFTLEAAQAVAIQAGLVPEEVPPQLRRLVDRQLILIDKRRDADRYRILEALRQQGRRRLHEAGRLENTERLHAEYFLDLAEQAAEARGRLGESKWLERLEGELENLRAALLWAVESTEADIGLRFGASLWWFWYQRSHLVEGRRWLDKLHETLIVHRSLQTESEERRRLGAELLNGAGSFAFLQGDFDLAEGFHEKALAIRNGLSSDRWVAGSLNNLGLIARRRGSRHRGVRLFRSAREISRAHGNAFWESIHLNNLGLLLRDWNDDVGARACQEESCTIAARIGADWVLAQALAARGVLAADASQLARARDLLERSRAIRVELQNPQGIADSLTGIARVERLASDPARSAKLYRDALDIFEHLGDRTSQVEALEGLAATFSEQDPVAAAQAFAAADAIRMTIGFPRSPIAANEVAQHLALARQRLGEQRFESEYSRARTAHVTKGAPPEADGGARSTGDADA